MNGKIYIILHTENSYGFKTKIVKVLKALYNKNNNNEANSCKFEI